MSKQRQAKAEIVNELKDKMADAAVVILTDYRGLNVAEITRLRRKLQEAGAEYRVVKNTLTARAVRELGLEELETFLVGPTAAAFSTADPVAPAKVLSEAMRKSKTFKIKAGILQGRVMGLNDIKALADLPSREQLLARLVGGLQAPIAGLANVMIGNTRNLVYALEAIREQKEQTA